MFICGNTTFEKQNLAVVKNNQHGIVKTIANTTATVKMKPHK